MTAGNRLSTATGRASSMASVTTAATVAAGATPLTPPTSLPTGSSERDCASSFFRFDDFPNQSRISSPLQLPPMIIHHPHPHSEAEEGLRDGKDHNRDDHRDRDRDRIKVKVKMEPNTNVNTNWRTAGSKRTPLDDVFADIPPSPLSSLLLGNGATGSTTHALHHPAAYLRSLAAASAHAHAQAQAHHDHDVHLSRATLPTATTTTSATATTTSSLGFTMVPLSTTATASTGTQPFAFSTATTKPSVSGPTHPSIPLSPYTSSLLLPLDLYAATPEGQRHHIHLMDSPASLLLHPHIAPSAGTLTPTPSTLPGVCADPKLLCSPLGSGPLPPATAAFAYQQTAGVSASSSVASALASLATVPGAAFDTPASRFVSPLPTGLRALSAPPMVESRMASPVREWMAPEHDTPGQHSDAADDAMVVDEHVQVRRGARKRKRATRQGTHEDEDLPMDVDVVAADEHAPAVAKRAVGRPRKSRAQPRAPEPDCDLEIKEEAHEVASKSGRAKRTRKPAGAPADAFQDCPLRLVTGMGDALLLATKPAVAGAPPEEAPSVAEAAPATTPAKKRARKTATTPVPDHAATTLMVGQVHLFPHPLDARVTDLRRHFKSRNTFGSGALDLALLQTPTASTDSLAPTTTTTTTPPAASQPDLPTADAQPQTTEQAKALGLSKDAIRQLRNKISARNFRQRKKQYIHTLEDQVLDLKRQLAEEVAARVEVEAKLNACEQRFGVVPLTPARAKWPVGWREEVGRIGADDLDMEEDEDEDEAEEGGEAEKRNKARAPAAAKKRTTKHAAAGAAATTPDSAAPPAACSLQPNQAPMPSGPPAYAPVAQPVASAMPPGIYSPLQHLHPSAAAAPAATPAGSAQAAMSHARKAAAAAVNAALTGQPPNLHALYQQQHPQYTQQQDRPLGAKR